jgi:hypothetical protein
LPAARLGFKSLTTLASPARSSEKSPTLPAVTLHMPASGQGVSRLNTQTGGARITTQRLGRPKIWPLHGAVVRRPGMHARSQPRAQRAARSPGSRGRVRRCRRDEARRQAHPPARSCSGRNPACTQTSGAATASSGRKSPRDSSASRRPPVRLGWPAAMP